MEAAIVSIGNSKGIRIPKIILEQCHIKQRVNIETKGESIIIRPLRSEARKNWGQSFQKMHENKDDQLLIDDAIDLGMERWEWK